MNFYNLVTRLLSYLMMRSVFSGFCPFPVNFLYNQCEIPYSLMDEDTRSYQTAWQVNTSKHAFRNAKSYVFLPCFILSITGELFKNVIKRVWCKMCIADVLLTFLIFK